MIQRDRQILKNLISRNGFKEVLIELKFYAFERIDVFPGRSTLYPGVGNSEPQEKATATCCCCVNNSTCENLPVLL